MAGFLDSVLSDPRARPPEQPYAGPPLAAGGIVDPAQYAPPTEGDAMEWMLRQGEADAAAQQIEAEQARSAEVAGAMEASRARALASRDANRARRAAMTPIQRARDGSEGAGVTSPSRIMAGLVTEAIPAAVGYALGERPAHNLAPGETADPSGGVGNRAREFLTGLGEDAYNTTAGAAPSDYLPDPLYSPPTLANEFVPFSDEIGGTIDAAVNDRPLETSLRSARDRRTALAEQNPGTAMAGMLAQGLVLSPMLGPAGPAAPATSVGRGIIQGVGRGIAEAVPYGMILGADRSEHSPLSAVSRPDLLTPAGAARVGTETLGLVQDSTTEGAATGLVGGVLGGAFGGAGYGARRFFTGLADDEAAAVASDRLRREVMDNAPIDDSPGALAGDFADDEIGAMRAPGDNGDLYDIAPEQNIGGLDLRSGVRADPHLAHMRAAGLTQQPQLRAQPYGPRGVADRLDAHGIIRRNEVIPQSEAYRRAEALRQRSGREIGSMTGSFDAEGHQIDLSQAVSELEALEARLLNSASPEQRAAAADVRRQIDVIAQGPDGTVNPAPQTGMQRLTDAIRARDQTNADFLSGSSTRAPTIARQTGLEMRQILDRARDAGYRTVRGEDASGRYRLARDIYATASRVAPAGRPSPAQMHAPTLSRRVLGGAGATAGASIGNAIAGAPGSLVGAGIGGVAGYAAGNALKEYEWAILSAMNNGRGTATEIAADIGGQLLNRLRGRPGYEPVSRLQGEAAIGAARDIAERIGDADVVSLADEGLNLVGMARRAPARIQQIRRALQVNPEAFGQYAEPLIDAARRGELVRRLSEFGQDPEARSAIDDAMADDLPDFDEMARSGYAREHSGIVPDAGIPETREGTEDDMPDFDAMAREGYAREHAGAPPVLNTDPEDDEEPQR